MDRWRDDNVNELVIETNSIIELVEVGGWVVTW